MVPLRRRGESRTVDGVEQEFGLIGSPVARIAGDRPGSTPSLERQEALANHVGHSRPILGVDHECVGAFEDLSGRRLARRQRKKPDGKHHVLEDLRGGRRRNAAEGKEAHEQGEQGKRRAESSAHGLPLRYRQDLCSSQPILSSACPICPSQGA